MCPCNEKPTNTRTVTRTGSTRLLGVGIASASFGILRSPACEKKPQRDCQGRGGARSTSGFAALDGKRNDVTSRVALEVAVAPLGQDRSSRAQWSLQAALRQTPHSTTFFCLRNRAPDLAWSCQYQENVKRIVAAVLYSASSCQCS